MIWRELFKRRRDAPWIGYTPVLIVTALFSLYGLHDDIPWHLIGLFVVCVLQLRYRTLAGWGFLFALCVTYGVAVLVTPDRNNLGESAIFAACAFVPAAALLMSYPRRKATAAPNHAA